MELWLSAAELPQELSATETTRGIEILRDLLGKNCQRQAGQGVRILITRIVSSSKVKFPLAPDSFKEELF